ncbi:MAG: hypothetical protein MI746_14445 [Pseudomonadales bacterium]|nr:hypothetical protein [Pseudomonadales bacterium]
MNTAKFDQKRYSEYCREHSEEFLYELREEAGKFLTNWPARTGVILLVLSSIATYIDASVVRENPYAVQTLFAYVVPISIIILYPFATLFVSTIEKFSTYLVDIFFLTILVGYCTALLIVFTGANSEEEYQSVYLILSGQVNFALLMCTGFAYHSEYKVTFFRNVFYTLLTVSLMYLVNAEFLSFNYIHIFQGFFAGAIMSRIYYDIVRARFYLKSTEADSKEHLHNQLSKLVYPHQLERIKLGDELENTMPLKEGKAIINVFDVQRSSEIRHEKTADFFVNLFQSFLQICMKGYEHNPLRSQAFRLKETGDGFISSVGYPFLPVDSRSLADSAVSTALLMFDAFNKEVERFNYSRPIKAAIGLAYNSVQGTFQSGGIRSYDLFGEALIQASKYEELRKQPVIWDIFCEHAEKRGFADFNILIVQEVVYNSLSPAYRELFTEIDLKDEALVGDFQMMYDNDARYIYFHLLP